VIIKPLQRWGIKHFFLVKWTQNKPRQCWSVAEAAHFPASQQYLSSKSVVIILQESLVDHRNNTVGGMTTFLQSWWKEPAGNEQFASTQWLDCLIWQPVYFVENNRSTKSPVNDKWAPSRSPEIKYLYWRTAREICPSVNVSLLKVSVHLTLCLSLSVLCLSSTGWSTWWSVCQSVYLLV
jgi:hypothetical protein